MPLTCPAHDHPSSTRTVRPTGYAEAVAVRVPRVPGVRRREVRQP